MTQNENINQPQTVADNKKTTTLITPAGSFPQGIPPTRAEAAPEMGAQAFIEEVLARIPDVVLDGNTACIETGTQLTLTQAKQIERRLKGVATVSTTGRVALRIGPGMQKAIALGLKQRVKTFG